MRKTGKRVLITSTLFANTVVALPLSTLDRFGMTYDRYRPEIIVKLAAKAGLSAGKCMSAWAYINLNDRDVLCRAATALGFYKPTA